MNRNCEVVFLIPDSYFLIQILRYKNSVKHSTEEA